MTHMDCFLSPWCAYLSHTQPSFSIFSTSLPSNPSSTSPLLFFSPPSLGLATPPTFQKKLEKKMGREKSKRTEENNYTPHLVCKSHHPNFNLFPIFHGQPNQLTIFLALTYHPFADDVQFSYTEEITFIDHSLG